MNYNSKQLFEDILDRGTIILNAFYEKDWRIYNYLLDLYYRKFGVNLRLTELSVINVIKKYNEVHGE